MKTESVLLQTLCVPCASHCRYCLLCWDGRPTGAPWERSAAFAKTFADWMRTHRQEVSFQFAFGYSMEHPALREAIRFLREIGSPQAKYLQCDGMRMRDEAECADLMRMLRDEGVEHVNFTVYGAEAYHDRFAGRKGDFALVRRMLRVAADAGLETSAGIPLTQENAAGIDGLTQTLEAGRIFLFIPHEEGRGVSLDAIRMTERDLDLLSEQSRRLLNPEIFRTEREWLAGAYREETKRTLLISLRNDNMQRYEGMDFSAILDEVEALDDAYYAAFPPFFELAARYGDPNGERLYRQRDLFAYYRRLYAKGSGVSVYDVTDERQSGSRRY